MLVKYTPEGDEAKQWRLDPKRVPVSHAKLIQKLYGQSYGRWLAGCDEADADAWRVLLWYLMYRDHPVLRIEDVPDFAMGDLQVSPETGEVDKLIADVRADDSRSPAERDQLVEALEALRQQAPESAGKAPTNDSPTSTGSTSSSDSGCTPATSTP